MFDDKKRGTALLALMFLMPGAALSSDYNFSLGYGNLNPNLSWYSAMDYGATPPGAMGSGQTVTVSLPADATTSGTPEWFLLAASSNNSPLVTIKYAGQGFSLTPSTISPTPADLGLTAPSQPGVVISGGSVTLNLPGVTLHAGDGLAYILITGPGGLLAPENYQGVDESPPPLPSQTPVPAPVWLQGTGLLGLALWGLRKQITSGLRRLSSIFPE